MTGIGRTRALVVGATLLAVFAGGVVVGALGARLVDPSPPPSPTAASPLAVASLPPATAPLPSGTPVATQTPTASPTPVATQVSTAGTTPVARTIVGRADALSGGPVAGVRIRATPAFSDRQPVPLPEATAVTNANGAYVLRVNIWTEEALGAGVRTVLFLEITPPPGFVVRGVGTAAGLWPGYPGVAFLEDDPGSRPVDIALVRGHILEGRVTSGLTGAPLPGAGVSALRPRDVQVVGCTACGADRPVASVTTDAAGRYSLTVTAGTYVISVSGPEPALRRFWSADPGVFEASPVTVERDLAGLDVALVPVGQISGVVRAGSSPFEADGVRVVAHAAAGTPCCTVVGRATAATIGGLGGNFLMLVPEGVYRILFEPPAGSPYAPQWWKGAADFATASDVRAGESGARLEADLAKAAR